MTQASFLRRKPHRFQSGYLPNEWAGFGSMWGSFVRRIFWSASRQAEQVGVSSKHQADPSRQVCLSVDQHQFHLKSVVPFRLNLTFIEASSFQFPIIVSQIIPEISKAKHEGSNLPCLPLIFKDILFPLVMEIPGANVANCLWSTSRPCMCLLLL